jgi:hypothetical protein
MADSITLSISQEQTIFDSEGQTFTGEIYIYEAGTKKLAYVNAHENPLYIKNGFISADLDITGKYDILLVDDKGEIVNEIKYQEYEELER